MLIGLFKLCTGAALTGRTGDFNFFIGGMWGCFIWFKVGIWKIKKRRENESTEEEIAASLRQIYGSNSTVVATNDCDGDQDMTISATPLKATPVVAAIRTTSSNYEKVNTEESSNIV